MINATQFSLFDNQPIIHANSTRAGGMSEGTFSSLNLGLNTNDNLEKVKQNRTIFFNHFNLNQNNLVFPGQIHSDQVKIVDQPGIVSDCDALITSTPGLTLTIQTADCFPLFIYDPIKHICAIVHSGWRGSAKNIASKTILKMQENFNSKSKNLLIAIGAGIQQKNYQVDTATASNFSKKFLIADGENHYKLSVQDVILNQLLEMGVYEENIEADKTCTFEAIEKYYSFRRDGAKSGRMMGFIGLR
ncbi:MAG: peptidoglycan editing factor PgeF [Calditrichaeota bacterium]|nr:MAG: peptidoglycan editing factor PgeF [Calditrichota bacterium]MBL1205844.1 peptidoglycan editing factor PgeF [Calditrichota bacterium]NOG45671.1 peptidoglycan editing factor PgeF [Calditrichota bacterium]